MVERNRELYNLGSSFAFRGSVRYSREEKMDELGGEAVNSVERRRGGLANRPQQARFSRSRVTEGRLEDLVNFPSGEGARHAYETGI